MSADDNKPSLLELRRWSAEKLMGARDTFMSSFGKFSYQTNDLNWHDWAPDDPQAPAWQLLAVIEAMAKLGWRLDFHYPSVTSENKPCAQFYQNRPYCSYQEKPNVWGGPYPNPYINSMCPKSTGWFYDDDPLLATLRAAYAAYYAGRKEE